MPKSSKDIPEESVVSDLLLTLKTEKDVRAFIKGEDRDAVMDAAVARINELNAAGPGLSKQGEQSDPITQQTHEFRGSGVEGTKDGPISGDQIIGAIDKTAFSQAQDVQRKALEAEAKNETEAAAKPKAHVTIDDVLARQRAEGKKV